MTTFELVYVLFWLDLSIICLLLLFFEQEIKEIYFLLTFKWDECTKESSTTGELD